MEGPQGCRGQGRGLEELVQCMYTLPPSRWLCRLLTLVQFVEYDPRAHRFVTLASFSFFVASESTTVVSSQGLANRTRQLCVHEPSQLPGRPHALERPTKGPGGVYAVHQ